MVNTKKTKYTGAQRCPMCSIVCSSAEAFKIHVVDCAMKEYSCDVCDYKSNKQANVRRHHQRNHKGIVQGAQLTALGRKDQQVVPSAAAGKPDEESDWQEQDPGSLLTEDGDSSGDEAAGSSEDSDEEDSELLVRRVVRKRTHPGPVFHGRTVVKTDQEGATAPKIVKVAEDSSRNNGASDVQQTADAEHQRDIMTTEEQTSGEVPTQSAAEEIMVVKHKCSVATQVENVGSSARDMECQTDGPEKKDVSTQCERYRRRSKEVRTTKYMEGGREVVIVQETEEFFNM